MLEVKVLGIDLSIDYGYNGCSGVLPENCEPGAAAKIIALDRQHDDRRVRPGIVIPLRPFFGSMGVAPAPELGRVSSNPPGTARGQSRQPRAGRRRHACTSRSSCRGALFEVGDGHAAQGDGEVDQTAIETSLRGRLQLTVRKDLKLTWPRAETPTDYISMATDPDLTIATKTAIQEMIDFLVGERKTYAPRGVSARQHRRKRRRHAAGGQAECRRARAPAQEHLRGALVRHGSQRVKGL